MYFSVIKVEPLKDYKLLLTFENNEKKIFDVNPYLNIGRYSELKNSSLFKSVGISFDTIKWNNEIDFDPEFLYSNSKAIDK
ncbi:MAG: DUF2442 domain-containing protein [Fidelibacterota bacterium]